MAGRGQGHRRALRPRRGRLRSCSTATTTAFAAGIGAPVGSLEHGSRSASNKCTTPADGHLYSVRTRWEARPLTTGGVVTYEGGTPMRRTSLVLAAALAATAIMLTMTAGTAGAVIHEQVAAYCSGGGHGAITDSSELEPPGIADPTKKNFASPVVHNGVVDLGTLTITDRPQANSRRARACSTPTSARRLPTTRARTATRCSPRRSQRNSRVLKLPAGGLRTGEGGVADFN